MFPGKLCAQKRNPENNRVERGALCPVRLKREKVGIRKSVGKIKDLNIDILILKILTHINMSTHVSVTEMQISLRKEADARSNKA